MHSQFQQREFFHQLLYDSAKSQRDFTPLSDKFPRSPIERMPPDRNRSRSPSWRQRPRDIEGNLISYPDEEPDTSAKRKDILAVKSMHHAPYTAVSFMPYDLFKECVFPAVTAMPEIQDRLNDFLGEAIHEQLCYISRGEFTLKWHGSVLGRIAQASKLTLHVLQDYLFYNRLCWRTVARNATIMATEPSPTFDPPYYRVHPSDYDRFGINVRHCLINRLPDKIFMRRTNWQGNRKGAIYTDLPNREEVYRALLRDESSVRQFIARPKIPEPRTQQSSFSQVYDIPWNAQRQRYSPAGGSSGSRELTIPRHLETRQARQDRIQVGRHPWLPDVRFEEPS